MKRGVIASRDGRSRARVVCSGRRQSGGWTSWTADGCSRSATARRGPVPRMADGQPDLSGVWWGGSDIGAARGRGGARRRRRRRAAEHRRRPLPASIDRGGREGENAERQRRPDVTLHPDGVRHTERQPLRRGRRRTDHLDAQDGGDADRRPIHGFRLVPTDGRPHRDDVPPSYRGDSVGRWEGDTFVVDTRNFTDNTWMSAEGRVSPHSDALHIVERYRRVDANTLEIEATVEDPEVLTAPWTVPKQTLVLAPFDRIMSLNCSGIETQALMDAAAKSGAGK